MAPHSLIYDAAGNVTWDNSTGAAYGYTYNAANRMESFAINGVVQAEFAYNPLGQQEVIRYTQTGQTVHVLFNAEGYRIGEYDFNAATNTSTLLREYVWMDGVPVAVVEGGAVYFVRTDHVGRPVFATDDTGAVVRTASCLPFGGVLTSSGNPSNLRFPGQWFQSETGLHQNGCATTTRRRGGTWRPARWGWLMGRACMAMRGRTRAGMWIRGGKKPLLSVGHSRESPG